MNADQFTRELDQEMDEVEREFLDFRKQLVRDGLERAESLTPRRTGKLAGAWGTSLHKPDRNASGGSSSVDQALVGMRPFDRVYVMNNDFRATFFEKGTVYIRPVRMWSRAARSVQNRARKSSQGGMS